MPNETSFDYHGHFVRITVQCVGGAWASAYSIDGARARDVGDIFPTQHCAYEGADMAARDIIRSLFC